MRINDKFCVLTSAEAHQLCWGHENEQPGNCFTDWLIEGTMPADTDGDGVVTSSDAAKLLRRIVGLE